MCGRSRSNLGYINSSCSRHMTRNRLKFLSLTSIEGGQATFEDNSKVEVIGKCWVGKAPNIYIENVLFVKGLKCNLLSISQFCDKGNTVKFDSNYCIVKN